MNKPKDRHEKRAEVHLQSAVVNIGLAVMLGALSYVGVEKIDVATLIVSLLIYAASRIIWIVWHLWRSRTALAWEGRKP